MTFVFTLGSCSNDRELDNAQTNSKEIGFRSFIDKGGETRATVTTKDNMLGFTVTGWWDRTGDDTNPGDIANALMNGDEYLFNAYDITRRESNLSDWTYSPLRYWPAPEVIGGGVTFFAYSPASSQGVSAGLYNYVGDPIRYTVPDPVFENSGVKKAVDQEDFLLARTSPKDSGGNIITSGNVMLNFAHALSRVKFFARTTNTNLTYVIGGVEMLGLAKTGEIELADIPLDGKFTYNDILPSSSTVTLWTSQTDKGSIGLDMGKSPINLLGGSDNSYHSLHGDINALMVLPQETDLGDPTDPNPDPAGGFLIKVLYKAYLNNPDGTYFAGSKDNYEPIYFKVTDKLRSINNTEVPFTFEIGRQYNFCLTFGSEAGDPITFDVKVGGWNDAPDINLQ